MFVMKGVIYLIVKYIYCTTIAICSSVDKHTSDLTEGKDYDIYILCTIRPNNFVH